MCKMTKEINIINVYNEKVIIVPVPYEIALKVIELSEESALLMDKIGKLFVKLYDEGITNIKEDIRIIKMMTENDQLDNKEKSLREKFNYWYCGLDNLDIEDKENLIKKYPRRNIKKEL